MMDETANLVLEHLKRFQAQMLDFGDRLSSVQQDMRAMKAHMTAFMGAEAAQDGEIASIQLRQERIERRLELRDQ